MSVMTEIPPDWQEQQILNALEHGARWVHGDGCLTHQLRPMYPICEHGSRALFLGMSGDRFVGSDKKAE